MLADAAPSAAIGILHSVSCQAPVDPPLSIQTARHATIAVQAEDGHTNFDQDDHFAELRAFAPLMRIRTLVRQFCEGLDGGWPRVSAASYKDLELCVKSLFVPGCWFS